MLCLSESACKQCTHDKKAYSTRWLLFYYKDPLY